LYRAGHSPAGFRFACDMSDEGLARRTQKDRHTEAMKQAEVPDQLQIMLNSLAKSDTRIRNDVFSGNPAPDNFDYPVLKIIEDVEACILVVRILLHDFGCALGMHENDRHTGITHH